MENTRRKFLKQSATIVAGTVVTAYIGNRVFAAENIPSVTNSDFPAVEKFTLPELPYAYDALEPHIDKQTMEIHHSKHHQKYVDELNKALSAISKKVPTQPTFESMFKNMDKLSDNLRNNAGGHYNHSLFWTLMKPNGGGKPQRDLVLKINSSFGSFNNFKTQFEQAAAKQFGSGWAWLVVTNDGKLAVTSTPNQDNPLMNLPSIETKGTPLLALDVWEHAYYLKNQNRRDEYISSWWNVVNWDRVNELYTPAK